MLSLFTVCGAKFVILNHATSFNFCSNSHSRVLSLHYLILTGSSRVYWNIHKSINEVFICNSHFICWMFMLLKWKYVICNRWVTWLYDKKSSFTEVKMSRGLPVKVHLQKSNKKSNKKLEHLQNNVSQTLNILSSSSTSSSSQFRLKTALKVSEQHLLPYHLPVCIFKQDKAKLCCSLSNSCTA